MTIQTNNEMPTLNGNLNPRIPQQASLPKSPSIAPSNETHDARITNYDIRLQNTTGNIGFSWGENPKATKHHQRKETPTREKITHPRTK